MISKKIQQALNEQINHEIGSAYLYLSMAAYFGSAGFDGMAQWMHVQAHEEYIHAMKFFNHILERDGKVELLELTKPKAKWATPLAAFQDAYKHEKFITSKIHALVELAMKEGDHAAGILLQWFVTEQVEEEATASKVVQMLERIGDSGNGMFMLDKELGNRTMTAETEEK